MKSIEAPIEPLQRLAELKKMLATALKRLLRKQEKQAAELAETDRAEWYRQVADSLLANPGCAPRGCSKIVLLNSHTQKEEPVSLNPRFDLRENAELLYKKARKGTRGREIARKKSAKTEKEVKNHKLLIAEAEAVLAAKDESKAIDLTNRIEKALGLPLTHGSSSHDHTSGGLREKYPYRHYTFDEWNVYIGKNETQNDELSTRFAKPQDLWLHAAGHAGSHVVIRRPIRTAPVPGEVVEKVASLALWFSKAKHTSYGEVHVTEARFVRKRRHAPPGEVVAERCKAVRVPPKSPHQLFPSLYDKESEE